MSSPSAAAAAPTDNQDVPNHKPEWLESLTRQDFHTECAGHSTPSIVTNRYCITCHNATCHHCLSVRGEHPGHTVLTVHKYDHCNVLLFDEMKSLVDCTHIQKYKSNKKRVISLIPLPTAGSGDSITAGDGVCRVCQRKLTMGRRRYSFCSIFCKFEFDEHVINKGDGIHMLQTVGRAIEARERALNQYKKKHRAA